MKRKRIAVSAIIVFLSLFADAHELCAQVTVTTIHSFSGPDGSGPRGRLVQGIDGNFYGTTQTGGSGVVNPFGTVFRITPSGTLTTLYTFSFQVTGDEPFAGLVLGSDGNFYGTTRGTGSYNGNIFRITPSGTLTELHAFGGFFFGDDGAHPQGELVQASDGNFYGVTNDNAAGGGGIVFKIGPSGGNTFARLQSLPLGANSSSWLVQASDGNLYGTTNSGGANGRGSVFRISTSGNLTTLYSFGFAPDGGAPYGGLVMGPDGNFYGTTHDFGDFNFGTIFRISPNGNYVKLHSFSQSEGHNPESGLVAATDGNFYGTTATGGDFGGGTIFRLTPNGNYTTLHSFSFSNGLGWNPLAELTQGSDGALYGTTYFGGAQNKGTVFRVTLAQAPTLQFSAANYSVGEGDPRVTVTVTRTGDNAGTATADYRTTDADTFTVGCADGAGAQSAAYGRCDFATAVGSIAFIPGETQKQITVPLIDDAHLEGTQTFQLRLSNPTGATLGTPDVATVTIQDNDNGPTANPIFGSPFFVRQNYLDFLSREPDTDGFNAWVSVLNGCSDVNNNSTCDRILVSQSFFGSPEFQLKGFYVFRFYRLAFDRLPEYLEIIPDMSFVAGQTAQEVFERKAQLANLFTQRTEFINTYGAQTNAQYVAALLGRYQLTQIVTPDPAHPDDATKITLTNADLVNRLNAATLTRAQVFRAIADSDQVSQPEFNNAFVAMQYYGYLRRKPEQSGYAAWLAVLQSGDIRAMVSGFMNSQEYRLRFGNPTQ